MRIYLFLLFIIVVNACGQDKKTGLKQELKKADPTQANNFREDIFPYRLEIDCDDICFKDTLKIRLIGLKYTYDSISIIRTKGFIYDKCIDSVYFISLPTENIAFLPNEMVHIGETRIEAEIRRKGRRQIKIYSRIVHFRISKEK